MTRASRRMVLPALLCALVLAGLASASTALAAAPAFTLTAIPAPSNFVLGNTNEVQVVDLVGRTDSVKSALRNTFEAVPDAPVSTFRLELFGGKRGLVEMSDGFCRNRHADIQLDGQNGKAYDTRPVVKAKCPKQKPRKRHRGHGSR